MKATKPNPEYVNAPYELSWFWFNLAGTRIEPERFPHRYRSWSDYDPKDPAKNSIPPVILDEEGEE